MALVLRSQIEVRRWADFVSKGPVEAEQFLNGTNVDAQQLNDKLTKAFPGAVQPLPVTIAGTLTRLPSVDSYEDFDFKFCSKLIHPSSMMLNHPEDTIRNEGHRQYLAKQVLYYAWSIITRFHNIN